MDGAIAHRHRQTGAYTYTDANSTSLPRLDKNMKKTHRGTDIHT